MRTRFIVILITLCTAGMLAITGLIWVQAQTTPEAQGLEINATGTGTAGRIVKWLTATSQGNSVLFESGGKIGIRTTAPAEALTVRTVTQNYGLVHTDGAVIVGTWVGAGSAGTPGGWVGTKSAHDLRLFAGNQGAALVVKPSGNVGIGTIAPIFKLDVQSSGVAIRGQSTSSAGVSGVSTSSTGVSGVSTSGAGAYGQSTNHAGVYGYSTNSSGVYGVSYGDGYQNTAATYGYALGPSGIGVKGVAGPGAGGTGVWGISRSGNYAGYFDGKVNVTGLLTKSAGSFKIDHPLDPENKYLSHSFVESPDMMNIYNGNVALNAQGQAVVHLPPYFSALNKDFRYQLTAIGAPGPNLHIAKEIANNRFTIAGGNAGQKVSWQVTGIRQDAYAEAHRIVVEEDKAKQERGFFLHPEAFGEPEEQGIQWGIRPEAMRQMQAERAALEAQAQEESTEEP